jgi:hypothetical protein
MKKSNLFLLVALVISNLGISQTVNYTVIKDNPFKPAVSLNVELMQIDINTYLKNLQLDNMSINMSVYGFVDPIQQGGIDFKFLKSYLAFGKLANKNYPGHFEGNLGVHFTPLQSKITKNVKVDLDSKTGTYNNKEVTTTTYIMIPATVAKFRGVRAGLYTKVSAFNAEDYFGDDFAPAYENLKITSAGIYGGYISRTIKNIIIEDPQYGRSINSIGRDFFFEALFVPINKFKNIDPENPLVDVTDDFKAHGKRTPFGFRIGYNLYQTEVKAFTGKKFGLCGTAEFGLKPYQGWFLNAGFGITLLKKASFGKKL